MLFVVLQAFSKYVKPSTNYCHFIISDYELCHLFTSFIINRPNCIQGIKILAQAVDKIRYFDSQLTAIHADLCQISLKSKFFKTALKLLELDITSVAAIENSRVQNGTVSLCRDRSIVVICIF